MLAQVYSGAVYGVNAYSVEIEVNASNGDPSIVIVGLPDTAVKESKDRVGTAIFNSGFKPHVGRTTVNLAPANIKKEGPSFDLPIAIGMLATQDEVPLEMLSRFALVGELALSGEVRKVKGVLPIAMRSKLEGRQGIIVPADNAEEAAVVEGLDVYPVRTLRQAIEILNDDSLHKPFKINIESLYKKIDTSYDYSDVKGQEQAKRAMEVAVAGGHNVLMVGPPGTGKTMLAKRIPSILPTMSIEEALETTRIHSIAGTLKAHEALVLERPFRSPHHTISDAGLLGGGTHPMPGEVSLAHGGVLFLDELPEFRRNVLEVLRQPLEDGEVTISRAAATVSFPCRFMLVAAMNPCKCGWHGDLKRQCSCSDRDVHQYRSKISGPLLDRIDIHIEVPSIKYQDLASLENGESSSCIRERAVAARKIQWDRFNTKNDSDSTREYSACNNAGMTPKDMQKHCNLRPESQNLLKMAITQLNFSARSYDRIRKVARTIADLDNSETIEPEHISEAIQYRTLDRQFWV